MKNVDFRRDAEGMKMLGAYLAQLVREGVTYKIENAELFIRVELTGGF